MSNVSSTWKRLSELQQDTLIAVGLTLLAWGQALLVWAVFGPPQQMGISGGPGPGPARVPFPLEQPIPALTPLAFLLLAACFMPLAFRRRWPIPVALAVAVAVGVYDIVQAPPVMTLFALVLAIYTVGTRYARAPLVFTTVAAIAIGLLGTGLRIESARWYADAVGLTAIIVASAAVGDATRNRRRYVAEMERRAIEAERTREEEARRRVDEERLRIARELHDVTAHSLSIIAVQSGAAERVVDTDPAAARRALASIRTTARGSLDELRSMLGVLRHTEDGTPLAPAPDLAQVDRVVASVREAGVDVVVVADDTTDVPGITQASAYRVIQESLTNVVRHAHATRANVSLRIIGDTLVVDVTDDGDAATQHADGHGITGMRERVTALGGTFTAGRAQPTGFAVHAEFPLPRRESR